MKELISPANLITVSGAVLTVVGLTAYLSGAANLSVPTLFYGFPIFLGGLALKTTELRPTKKISPKSQLSKVERKESPELAKVVKDVTRWRYGQHAHLESSLIALKLWDQENPPQLLEIEELETTKGLGIRLRFNIAGVPFDRWQEKQERLGRFFAKDMQAELISPQEGQIDLMIVPKQSEVEQTTQHGTNGQ
ncbi:DUF2854 domain-containing protein [Prochlorococcus sp. MIT 1307]|uniref:DUF2854 domain-containing protein n=1 Tax=Prochlorococcus sp. MIT 1307 TaxID=3096219 RepID=UPI002A75426F|nr:DUF2854 domain-containing protein [Prochlorococcus sp. MIT 1307]